MTDDELRYWGEYGRSISPSTVLLADPTPLYDPMKLWNAFGALEAKVRQLEAERE